MSSFEKAIVDLCAEEFAVARQTGDRDRLIGMIEVIGSNLATALALTARHAPIDLDQLIAATCEAVAESARRPHPDGARGEGEPLQ